MRDAYLGTALAEPEPKTSGRGLVVCASGRLAFARQPEAFVRLAQRLTDARNGVKCVWIGDGELRPLMEEMIRDMGLTGKLEVTGWLPHEEALRRLADSDVLVHYSRWDAIPNAVLEAMACGLPVAASDIPGNRGLIVPGENGLLAATEIELLERTLQLIDDPELRCRLGARGRAVARDEYSRERLLKEISELYNIEKQIKLSN
ncbi:MAG: glycosyltransferase [Elusimicrobia bacterium]|nr:glycosyltransferase [Elusimicrobiota bacterium]